MKAFTSKIFYILALLALLFAAMPSVAFAQDGKEGEIDALCVDEKHKHDYFLLEAYRQMQLGNLDAAFELFDYCLQLNPNSDVVLYEMAKFMNYLQEDSIAEDYLERAVRLSPENYWYGNALANIYVKEGRIDEAVAVVENLSVKHPGKSDVLAMLIDLYMRNEDYASVIKTLERLEVKEGKSEMISTEKFRVYLMMGDEEHAYEEIVNLGKEYPNDLRYKVLLGDMYVEHGRADKALEVYKAVEQEDSTNLNVMVSLADYYRKQNEDSLYQRQIDKLVTNDKFSAEMKLQIMTSLVYESIAQKEDSTKMLNRFRKILSSPQENNDMAELYVRYMVSLEMDKDSIKPVLDNMLTVDPEDETVRTQLLSYAIQDDDTAEVYRICKSAVDIPLKNTVYYYFLSIVYYQRDEHRLAIDMLKKGLANADENTQIDIIANSYSMLGELYYLLCDVDKAFEAYDSCLIYTPDDVSTLNNYAYYLSLRNQKLERAKEMSYKTIVAEPENYVYLDTYAWILFVLEEYEVAKEYIDKCISVLGEDISSDDSNIIEHAGDIYYMAGEKAEAVRFWLKAQELGADSKVLKKKIKKKKYFKK